jgi:hypothetical protein
VFVGRHVKRVLQIYKEILCFGRKAEELFSQGNGDKITPSFLPHHHPPLNENCGFCKLVVVAFCVSHVLALFIFHYSQSYKID